MPSISTMLYPQPAYVRVETNWADVTQATGVKVERVDCETGERVPLRPYVSYDGDHLTLSCGYAIFWDTEPQLDRCVYYCATAIDANGDVVTTASNPIFFDDFNRINVDTWNTATSGHVYTISGGVAADRDVNGALGTIALTSTSALSNIITITDNFTQAQSDTGVTQIATGDTIFNSVSLGADGSNLYMARLQFRTDSTARLDITKRVGAVQTTITVATTIASYAVNQMFSVKLEVFPGSLVRAKAWAAIDPEPDAWTHSVADSSLLSMPSLLLRAQRGGANTNVGLLALFDNASAGDVCATTETVETCSDDLIVPSNGDFRLGDPVRPCHDVILRLGEEVDPNCVPTQGIFFGNMATENFGAMTSLFTPTNARYPIAISRTRQAISSTLTLVTRTFPDRDDLRILNEPGSPLFLRGPAAYGIADRYMSVADVNEARGMSDHKVTPRLVTLPHVEVARPSGPSQGVCGAQVDDLCDIYATWDALAASGLTWADLIRGKASNDTPVPDSVEMTWAEVNATYADWNAANSGNTDWDDLLDGA